MIKPFDGLNHVEPIIHVENLHPRTKNHPNSTINQEFCSLSSPILLGNHATPIGIQRFKGLHRLLLHELLVPQAAEVPRGGRAVGGEERHPFLEVDPQGVALQQVAVPVLPGPGRCWEVAGKIRVF